MANKSERLAVLSNAEQFALYGLPDFDDGQRLEYLSLSEPELALACSRPGLHTRIYCVLQIGYFKRVFEKHHMRVRRFSISRTATRSIMVSEVCTLYS